MTTEELYDFAVGIKAEVFDIKEYLADYDNRITNVSKDIENAQINISQHLNNELSKYMTSVSIADTYYNKSEINKKFNDLDFILINDVEDYLQKNNYITYDSIKGFITINSLNTYLNSYMSDYQTIEKCNKLYVTKNEIEQITDNKIDLSTYVNYLYLQENYYNKSEVENLIPSTSGFVKKSELYTLLPFNNYALTDWVDETFIKKNEISLDGYVTENMLESKLSKFDDIVTTKSLNSTLSKYVKENEFNESLSNLSKVIKDTYIPLSLSEFKKENDFITKNDIKEYVTKKELSNYIISDNGDSIDVSEFIKQSDLDNYVNIDTLDKRISDVDVLINKKYIPTALDIFKSQCGYVTEDYANHVFATKEEFRNYILNGSVSFDNDVLNDYVKLDYLNKYVTKLEISNYVDCNVYNNDLISINNNISTINNSLKKYATTSQLKDYVRENILNTYLNDYVTKENLSDELSKLSEIVNCNVDTSNFLTYNDYNNFKSYVNSTLTEYVTSKDVYTKTTIDNYFVKSNKLENYYTKNESNNKYLSKEDATIEYLKVSDAYSEFLSKEDYRGIKDAMTLNSAYKHAGEIFEALLENSKLLDGFYLVDDTIVVVKNNKPYSTNLTGSNSYTKNEIDDMNFVTKDELNKYKNKKWIIDTGGKY